MDDVLGVIRNSRKMTNQQHHQQQQQPQANKKMSEINIKVPASLYKEFKHRAIEEETSVSEVFTKAMILYLKGKQQQQQQQKK